MKVTRKNIKKAVLKNLFWDKQVDEYYRKFSKAHPGFMKEHPFSAMGYILKLNKTQHNQKSLGTVVKPEKSEKYYVGSKARLRYFTNAKERQSVDSLYNQLKTFEVISFDIFDTLIYRKVEHPNDVFWILASEIKHNDFEGIRKKAEDRAREDKFREAGTREVTLSEIYQVLYHIYGIEERWQNREIELEIELSVVNPYMYEVYQRLLNDGKTIILVSDMYLPKDVIEKILQKNGYEGYTAFYLSNDCGLRKGDGTLQKKVLEDFAGKNIIHVGDSLASDVKKSIEMGMDAVHNPSSAFKFREPHLSGLAGSFYRAVIDNTVNNGTWNENIHYEHGFRVGGILAAGFCEYINKLCAEKKIDKILFCARDCEILWKVYNEYYKEIDNEYIDISRYAIMNAVPERYLYDLVNRFIIRYANQNRSSKTIESILYETGYGYLVDYLEEDDIERFMFPVAIAQKKLENFIFKHRHVILEHNQENLIAAKKYFGAAIGDKKNILVVDIGWSGTCITALKYLVETHMTDKECSVTGALMCTSRGNALTNNIADGTIYSYIYSPFSNCDITRFIMPAGVPALEKERRHMPLEYLFTSIQSSLVAYKLDENRKVFFERTGNEPVNKQEITDMQQGILDFVRVFREYSGKYSAAFSIEPYIAFMPLMDVIKHPMYCCDVYGNFLYDACTAPYAELSSIRKFSELFEQQVSAGNVRVNQQCEVKKKILFVTPELTYTGTPRSLLRMCKVAVELGYEPIVWSAKTGPFIQEYEKNNFKVTIVPEADLDKKAIIKEIKSFDMAICNTIVTDKYARKCSMYIPVIWYIREATNIPDFCRNNEERLYTLKHSKSLCCVSDYAAAAIGEFTKQKVRIAHNSVEDEVDMAVPYIPGSGEKIKFVQFGTMEYRKGYDVLVAAYKAMPKEYRNQAELYFAGGFINSGAPYCSYLFSKMKDEENIHYLGVVKGEKNKIETLSKMDVVVVASRDESCSLVALEGTMLSKPIIVTENVGAKYMVTGDNGIIAKTGDVESLKNAMMHMIDNKMNLKEWGILSRKNYEAMASMDSYTRDMQAIYNLTERKGTFSFRMETFSNRFVNSKLYRNINKSVTDAISAIKRKKTEYVVVSLTSHPGRINKVHITIESLLSQKAKPKKILLWLSKVQFPGMNNELPKELLKLTENSIFEIRWAEGDMAPHKKYLYTVKEFPELPVIIVDDDVIYDEYLVEKLMNSYRKFPHCISCMRANFMMFRPDGTPRIYDRWILDYKLLTDVPSYQLLPTGVGGVLYPPHSLPEVTFNYDAIKETCLFCDDLWLKIMVVHNGYPTVVPKDWCGYNEIPETQHVALWRNNVHRNNNDVSLENILNYFDNNISSKDELLTKMRQDRFC